MHYLSLSLFYIEYKYTCTTSLSQVVPLVSLVSLSTCTSSSFSRYNSQVPYAALVFNNVLDNGEPDERSLHEGVAPTKGIKYAINGWVRAKHLID